MPRRTEATSPDSPGASLASSAFSHYVEELHQFLLRRLPRAEDAADLMQEVFLRLLRLKRVELIRNPQAYLYGIASRVVRDYRLKAHEHRVVFDSEVVEQRSEHPQEISPDAFADGIGLEQQLEQALELLTPIQLQIFLLERCKGLTQAEIASKLGLSPHTIKKYAVQALAIVRLHCKESP
jgi:RNA polymerase sigma factor (sigma-70 family)